jgi:predicted nucleotide-binding protein
LQYEASGVGDKALKFRARQNVILELGYFYGFLGWDKVFVLEKSPPHVFPDYERPSDLHGVLFDRFDASGKWKNTISARMAEAGFKVSAG